MKNLFSIILILFVSFNSYSQSMVVWLDYHTPVKGKGSELSDAIKEKTQKYNQGADDFKLYTWQVMAGPNQGSFARAGVGPTWADFDNSSVSPKELDYWMDNVDPLIASSTGREYYVRSDQARSPGEIESLDAVTVPANKNFPFPAQLPEQQLLVDASRNDPPYNKNSYPGFDQDNQYQGVDTPLDKLYNVEANKRYSDNAMDQNWGGVEYSKRVVGSGYYDANIR